MAEERDPDVSRRYRSLGGEEPPPALDDAILAASRRGVARGTRWYVPVAAAAAVVLAVAVALHVEREKPQPEAVTAPQQTPADGVAAPDRAVEAPKPLKREEVKPEARDMQRERAKEAAPAARQAEPQFRAEQRSPAPAAAPVPPSDASSESPERALESIADMRKKGRHEDADKALAEFRRRYPDYPIPDALANKK